MWIGCFWDPTKKVALGSSPPPTCVPSSGQREGLDGREADWWPRAQPCVPGPSRPGCPSNSPAVCGGMRNYAAPAFDLSFPSELNCPHVELRAASLGLVHQAQPLSCLALWNPSRIWLKAAPRLGRERASRGRPGPHVFVHYSACECVSVCISTV